MAEPSPTTAAADGGARDQRQRRIVGAGILAFTLVFCVVGFTRHEAYPFSSYPMFRDALADPAHVRWYDITAWDANGHEVHVARKPFTNRIRVYAGHGRFATDAGRTAFAQEVVAYGRRLGRDWRDVRVTSTTATIPAYPGKPFDFHHKRVRVLVDTRGGEVTT